MNNKLKINSGESERGMLESKAPTFPWRDGGNPREISVRIPSL
jgi:hypothetical protein